MYSHQAPHDTTIFSVSQLNRQVKHLLEQHFFAATIIGEISNLSQPASGHYYFSLKDQQSQIRCALFKHQAQRLTFKPKNGLQVKIIADVSLYEARGDYQLIVQAMQETGEGILYQQFEELKSKLDHKGWFATDIKKPIPAMPRTVGIITSATGAAVRDIQATLKRRFPSIPLIIYPCMVQGIDAKHQISLAIKTANRRKECDVLILARGGGSLEDLWAFNEEIVATAIHKSRLPIITGIGHETDTTIADFVADLRAATPTAAAEHSTPDVNQLQNALTAQEQHLKQLIHNTLNRHIQNLHWLYKDLTQYHPKNKIQQHQQQLATLQSRLHAQIAHNLQHKQQSLAYLSQSLNLTSPLTILQRGYSITKTSQNELIHSSQQVKTGETISTRLHSGTLTSKITDITHD